MDLRFCISNTFPGDMDAAGPWITVIKVRDQ